MRDRINNTNELVTLNDVGGQTSGSFIDSSSISGDGNVVVYSTQRANIITGYTPTQLQLFAYNRATQEVRLISKGDMGQEPNFAFEYIEGISYDGSEIVLYAQEPTFGAGGNNVGKVMFLCIVGAQTQWS